MIELLLVENETHVMRKINLSKMKGDYICNTNQNRKRNYFYIQAMCVINNL